MSSDQVFILEYFWADCIPLIVLKHFDLRLMSVVISVQLSMNYHQNETFKTSFLICGQ